MLSLEPCWGSRSRLEQNCSTWAVWPPGDSWQALGMCLTPGEGGWRPGVLLSMLQCAGPGVTGAAPRAPG